MAAKLILNNAKSPLGYLLRSSALSAVRIAASSKPLAGAEPLRRSLFESEAQKLVGDGRLWALNSDLMAAAPPPPRGSGPKKPVDDEEDEEYNSNDDSDYDDDDDSLSDFDDYDSLSDRSEEDFADDVDEDYAGSREGARGNKKR